jgi:hypothetical protein
VKRIFIGLLLAGAYLLAQVRDANAAQLQAIGEGCGEDKDTAAFLLGDKYNLKDCTP